MTLANSKKNKQIAALERTELRHKFSAAATLLIILALITAFYFHRAQPSIATEEVFVFGKILKEPPIGPRLTSTEYTVILEDGRTVKARGIGRIPMGYLGRVKLRVEHGQWTETEIYYIESAEQEPQEGQRLAK